MIDGEYKTKIYQVDSSFRMYSEKECMLDVCYRKILNVPLMIRLLIQVYFVGHAKCCFEPSSNHLVMFCANDLTVNQATDEQSAFAVIIQHKMCQIHAYIITNIDT